MGCSSSLSCVCFLAMQAHIKYSYVLVSYISTYNVMLIAIACAVAETRPWHKKDISDDDTEIEREREENQ